MGYTHYWYRKPNLNAKKFKAFAEDCKKIAAYSQEQLGIAIAGGLGEGKPKIDNTGICLNGSNKQPIGTWTTSEHISIPWPSSTASIEELSSDPIKDKTAGNWFAGTLVSQRVAPIDNNTGFGSGSYETFSIYQKEYKKDEELIFNYTKTGYRPYDLVVTACLVAFKHHFKNEVKVSTDGEEKDWIDARIMCNNLFGYGLTEDLFSEPKEL